MTDSELYDRIKGKPWAWPGLRFVDGGWWVGRRALFEGEAHALIRVACEDSLDADGMPWKVERLDSGRFYGFVPTGCCLVEGADRLDATLALREAVDAQRSAAKGGG